MSSRVDKGEQMVLEAGASIKNPVAAAAFVDSLRESRVFATAGRSDQEFNWDKPDNPDDVAIPTQGAIAVYLNEGGGVSIRQEALWNEEFDPVIYIHPRNIDALIERLQACRDAAMRKTPTTRG